ncbi:MAG: acyl carrier protein [Pedobacter sp.]|nr:acyl carrier protein [Pedobacter sp.]
MKTIKLLFILGLAVLTVTISSCKKDSLESLGNENLANGQNQKMSFKDGAGNRLLNQTGDIIRHILSEHFGDEDILTMGDGTHLFIDLGCDDLDFIEILMDIESEFGIEIPDDDAETLKTIGNLIMYVDTHVGGPEEPEFNYGSTVSYVDSEESPITEYNGPDTLRSKKVAWVFCDGDIWTFQSREQMGQIKKSGAWEWLYIVHLSEYVVGNMLYGEVFIDGFEWDKVQSTSQVTAKVEWRTRIVADSPIGGGTSYGDYEESSHTWSSF